MDAVIELLRQLNDRELALVHRLITAIIAGGLYRTENSGEK